MALVTRIEVLNQHEPHAGIVRKMGEQLTECLQPPRGRAYANNVGWTAVNELGGGPPDDR